MLYLVSTPIGNLEDISLRALRILREAEIVLTEDSRRTGLLFTHFEIPHKPFISFYDEVEAGKTAEIIAHLVAGKTVALVSDAGTPLISDPGYKLVRACLEHGIKVEAIPGASAVLTALVSSGLPPDKFIYLGYLPERQGHRTELLNQLKLTLETLPMTAIIFASPYKVKRDLTGIVEVFGDIEIVVARELTKIHEEVWRGRASEGIEG